MADGYVAVTRLRWGEGYIEAGDPVPVEEGRNYASLLRLGRIARAKVPGEMTDDEVRADLVKVTAERDALTQRVAELEADEEEIPPVEIPDGVVPGETPGWPLVVLPFTDEQRELLVGAGVSGTFTAHDLRAELDRLREAAAATGDAAGDGDQPPAIEGTSGSEGADGEGALPEGVTETSPGWFQLADGTKVHGRKALDEALAKG